MYVYSNDTLERPILRNDENLMKACMLLSFEGKQKNKLRSGIKD